MENKRPVKITETILRDAHQSLIATRMTTDEMLGAVELLDKVGFNALEAWGGATFDSCLRFLKEDPWERLRKIKDKAKNTPLQMLCPKKLAYKGNFSKLLTYPLPSALKVQKNS